MFFEHKISQFSIILMITGRIFTLKFTVFVYSKLNSLNIEQNSTSFNILESTITSNLTGCMHGCSLESDCDAVVITASYCHLVNILNDTNLIQDYQAQIYLKKNNSKYEVLGSRISKIFYYLM